jgi:hypothetical protein
MAERGEHAAGVGAAIDRVRGGGPAGNERLTAAAAAVVFLLLAIEGLTILFLRPLLSLHVFVGLLLIPPIALKLASTGYRFARYYGGSASYRARGAPQPAMRLLAPLLVLTTAALFGSGFALILAGPPASFWLGLHKASFVLWFAAASVHVLAYARRVPRLSLGDWRASRRLGGARGRRMLVAAALTVGVLLGLMLLPRATPWHARFDERGASTSSGLNQGRGRRTERAVGGPPAKSVQRRRA